MKNSTPASRPKRMAAFGSLILLAVTSAALSAGGGGTSTAATHQPITISKSELIKRGDAICAKTDRIQTSKMNAYAKKHPNFMQSKKAFIVMVKQVALPQVRVEIEELADLGAPKGEEATVVKIISGFEKAQQSAEANAGFAMGLTEGPFTAPAELASEYGFKDCAEPL